MKQNPPPRSRRVDATRYMMAFGKSRKRRLRWPSTSRIPTP
jgi:hypothetical protein